MDWKAAAFHVLSCVAVGVLLARFTDASWLAASLCISAALVFNGSLAVFEDAQPGGFDNPEGSRALPLARGFAAFRFWVRTFAICAVLLTAAFIAQFGW